jgi:flagellar basal body-associated protein FliL
MQPSIMRDDRLHDASRSWWSKQRTVGKWVREDNEVRRTVGKLIGGLQQSEVSAAEGEELLKQRVRDSVQEFLKAVQDRPLPS